MRSFPMLLRRPPAVAPGAARIRLLMGVARPSSLARGPEGRGGLPVVAARWLCQAAGVLPLLAGEPSAACVGRRAHRRAERRPHHLVHPPSLRPPRADLAARGEPRVARPRDLRARGAPGGALGPRRHVHPPRRANQLLGRPGGTRRYAGDRGFVGDREPLRRPPLRRRVEREPRRPALLARLRVARDGGRHGRRARRRRLRRRDGASLHSQRRRARVRSGRQPAGRLADRLRRHPRRPGGGRRRRHHAGDRRLPRLGPLDASCSRRASATPRRSLPSRSSSAAVERLRRRLGAPVDGRAATPPDLAAERALPSRTRAR